MKVDSRPQLPYSVGSKKGAVGLAASQVGVDARMIFLDQRILGDRVAFVQLNGPISKRSPLSHRAQALRPLECW